LNVLRTMRLTGRDRSGAFAALDSRKSGGCAQTSQPARPSTTQVSTRDIRLLSRHSFCFQGQRTDVLPGCEQSRANARSCCLQVVGFKRGRFSRFEAGCPDAGNVAKWSLPVNFAITGDFSTVRLNTVENNCHARKCVCGHQAALLRISWNAICSASLRK
jgi:hypothetical protein